MTTAPPPPLADRRTFGRFELAGQLGAGAMGAVHRAYDPVARREVALKVLALPLAAFPEAERAALVARFEREARLASALDHPGIARVYEAGEAEGAPWIAMELVAGETLAALIARRASEKDYLRRAVGLIAEAALAIEAAHRRGVIHRDIKPANILVEAGSGRARVTDFGLARELSPGSRLSLTEEGQALGTPQYMAPEQARGDLDALDAQTDVYGLGATLYEALTGQPPFDGDAPWKVALAVLRGELVPPRALDATIPEDLDRICRCALAPDKTQRYDSAAELAGELRAWLAGRGRVRGRPRVPRGPSLGALFVLAVRRNRAVAATIAAALAVIVAGTAGFLAKLRDERDRAERRAEVARKALQTLVYEVETQLDDVPGEKVRAARQRLLETALAGAERLGATVAEDAPVALATAEAQVQIGALAIAAGAPSRAEAAFAKACDIARRVAEETKTALAWRHVASALDRLAGIRRQQGDLPGALRAAEDGIAVLRQLIASREGSPRDRRNLAVSLEEAGHIRRFQGDRRAALAFYEEALAIARTLGPEHGRDLAGLLVDVGDMHDEAGEPERALALYEEAVTVDRAVVAADPTGVLAREGLAIALLRVGDVHHLRGANAKAAAAYEESAAIARDMVRDDPAGAIGRRALASALYKVARWRLAEGNLAAADRALGEALTVRRNLVAQDSGNLDAKSELGYELALLARLRAAQGDLAGAEAAAVESLAIDRALAAADPSNADARRKLAAQLEALSDIRRDREDLVGARAALEEAVAIARELAHVPDPAPEDLHRLSSSLGFLGLVRGNQGDVAAAAAIFEEAVANHRALAKKWPEYEKEIGWFEEKLAIARRALAEAKRTAAPAGGE